MFDFSKMSIKKVKALYYLFECFYYVCTLIVPVIIVAIKYGLFKKVNEGTKLSGIGIIVAMIVVIVGIRLVKKETAKLPQETIKEQRLKYTLQMIFALVGPAILLVILELAKKNFDLAYITLKWCSWWFVAGICIEYLIIRYAENEMNVISEAKHSKRVDGRKTEV